MTIAAFVIGTVGLLLSIVSLVLQYFSYKRYEPKLVIKEDGYSFTFNPSEYPISVNDNKYTSGKAAVVSVKISNISANPITVDAVWIESTFRIMHRPFKSYDFELKIGENRYVSLAVRQAAVLPVRIAAYDTQYLSFRFPFYDSGPENYTMHIETPKKAYKIEGVLLDIKAAYDLKIANRK
jgi:hypothetical protein